MAQESTIRCSRKCPCDTFWDMLNISSLPMSKVDLIKAKLLKEIEQLRGGRVLIVGDLCLDEYVMGKVHRISPEAPVPVVDVSHREFRLGLAAYVAQNVVSLGGQCSLVGVIGDDATAVDFKRLLQEAAVNDEFLILDKNRPTTRKTRILSDNHHIVRVDFEKRKFLSNEIESQLLKKTQQQLVDADVLVLEDYAKGVFSEKVTQSLISEAHRLGKKVLVDPHRTTPVQYYKGCDLLKPNRDEAFVLSGLNIDDLREDSESLAKVAEQIMDQVKCQNLIVTMGAEGLVVFGADQGKTIPTLARQTFDVTGAGDTVLATLSLALASGFSLDEASVLANCAAGVVVGKVGCVPCQFDELKSSLERT